MKRKSIRRLLCIMLTGAMLLAGCGSSEAGGNKESAPAAAEATAAAVGTAADTENGGTAEVSGKGPIVDEKVTYILAEAGGRNQCTYRMGYLSGNRGG